MMSCLCENQFFAPDFFKPDYVFIVLHFQKKFENLSQVIRSMYSFIVSVTTFPTSGRFADIDISAK